MNPQAQNAPTPETVHTAAEYDAAAAARAPADQAAAPPEVDAAGGDNADDQPAEELEPQEPQAEEPSALEAEFGAELSQRLQGHVQKAVERNQAALRERFGDQLAETVTAANRTLQRFAEPELRAALRANPVLAAPGLVDLLARIDAHLRAAPKSPAAKPGGEADPSAPSLRHRSDWREDLAAEYEQNAAKRR